MAKLLAIGTTVEVPNDYLEGVVTNNRETMPDLARRFDYTVLIDLGDGERVEWGYAGSELREKG